MSKYSVIVPIYNEELVVRQSYERLKKVMDAIDEPYEIVFINDGSKDNTAKIVSEICRTESNVKLINFSRNFGHQIAITAGMDHAIGDAVIVIDADLQDPPEVITQMIEKWKCGYEVVYGKRVMRKGETMFKKITAKIFYRTLRTISNVDIPADVGDFRLIDRKVCDVMKNITEQNRYIRGLIAWMGFNQTAVEYVRQERFAGETKYPLKKMIKFAMDGIHSFSSKPLKLATDFGILLLLASVLSLMWQLICKIAGKHVNLLFVMFSAVMLSNAIMLITLGIASAYIGRIYDEVKRRPLYVIKDILNDNK